MGSMMRRNPRTAWRRVEGEVLIISSDTNRLTILNDSGARIWELLVEKDVEKDVDDVDGLARSLSDEFEVDLASARRDVESFLEEMEKRGLVVRESGP